MINQKKEKDRLLSAIAVRFLYEAAARAEDAASLNWNHVSFNIDGTGSVVVLAGKSSGRK